VRIVSASKLKHIVVRLNIQLLKGMFYFANRYRALNMLPLSLSSRQITPEC